MTITTTIRCDACGKSEPFRGPYFDEREWQELLYDGQYRHVCSTACVLRFLEETRVDLSEGG